MCRDTGAQADSHCPQPQQAGAHILWLPASCELGSAAWPPPLLEKLSWMFYLFSYSQKWPDLREKLWEGHIRVLRALVHNTGHTEHTYQTQITLQFPDKPTPPPGHTAHWNNSKRITNTLKSDSGQGCLQCQAEAKSFLNWGCGHLHVHMFVI